MTIQWGVSPIAWSNDDMTELGGETTLETILTDAKSIGFDGVELGNKFPRDPETLAPIMAAHGLRVVGGWYSSNLLVRSAEEEISALKGHLDLLKAMSSDVFIIAETSNAVHCDRKGGRLNAPPRLPPGDWSSFGNKLNTVADFLNGEGLKLAYHHHLGTVVEQREDLLDFIESTNSNVGLVLDTGHAIYGNIDPVEVIRSYPERINHVHCKDVRTAKFREFYSSGVSFLDGVVGGMFTAPGDGDYDYEPFMSALSDISYSGWIVVEAEQDPAIANPREYSELGLGTLKTIATRTGLVP